MRFPRSRMRIRKLLAARSQLEHQNERLEETVQQRTSALQSEIAERKRLEKANLQAERLAMVGTIAAQVAHEVRNPLGSITLNLDLIAKQIETLADTSRHPAEEGRTLVNEMREEVHRIQRVIEDYLRFARLRNPQRKPVKLNEFLEQKLAFMGSAFENAGVRLRTDFDAGVEDDQRGCRATLGGAPEPRAQQPRSDAAGRGAGHQHPAAQRGGDAERRRHRQRHERRSNSNRCSCPSLPPNRGAQASGCR